MAMTTINFAPTFPRAAGTFAKALTHAFAVRRQRIALKALDSDRLNDLGLNYPEAMKEAKRPLWDAPSHWKA